MEPCYYAEYGGHICVIASEACSDIDPRDARGVCNDLYLIASGVGGNLIMEGKDDNDETVFLVMVLEKGYDPMEDEDLDPAKRRVVKSILESLGA